MCAIGGILYISYNSTPGWSAAMPLRHLMNLHADLASSESSGALSEVDAALALANGHDAFFIDAVSMCTTS